METTNNKCLNANEGIKVLHIYMIKYQAVVKKRCNMGFAPTR